MTEIKNMLQRLRRSSLLRRSDSTEIQGRSNSNDNNRVQKKPNIWNNVNTGLGIGMGRSETHRHRRSSGLSHRASAFMTQPLTNEELDSIKYNNFATERDFRRGVRPKLSHAPTIAKLKRTGGFDFENQEGADPTETSAIIEEFSRYLENSFSEICISVDTEVTRFTEIRKCMKESGQGFESLKERKYWVLE